MLVSTVFFALLQGSAVAAQVVLRNPITGITPFVQGTDVKDGHRWNTWQLTAPIVYDATEAAAIKSGDFFDFSLSGDYVQNREVPNNYDFTIKNKEGDDLFHVSSAGGYAFRATATSFFDTHEIISGIEGEMIVEFLFQNDTPQATTQTVRLNGFSTTVNILSIAGVDRAAYLSWRRQGTYLVSQIYNYYYDTHQAVDHKFSTLTVVDGVGFAFEPTGLLQHDRGLLCR